MQTFEMRRLSDFGVLSSFLLHDDNVAVESICELQDGSFVSAAWNTVKRWDEEGTVLQTFFHSFVNIVIELNRDVIVSAGADDTVNMWKVSTGECLRTLTFHSQHVVGLAKVKDGVFASGSYDGMIVVWDEKGECIETHQSKSNVHAMTRLRDGSIVSADSDLIEIRQL